MKISTITTEGVYKEGILVPKVKPSGKRTAIITFLRAKGNRVKTDETVWREIEPVARKIRRQHIQEMNSAPYAKAKKGRKSF